MEYSFICFVFFVYFFNAFTWTSSVVCVDPASIQGMLQYHVLFPFEAVCITLFFVFNRHCNETLLSIFQQKILPNFLTLFVIFFKEYSSVVESVYNVVAWSVRPLILPPDIFQMLLMRQDYQMNLHAFLDFGFWIL